MKKKLLCAFLLISVFCMTGCIEKINLDEKQQEKFIQYSVYSVLEHDKNYLVELETIKETEEIPTSEPESSTKPTEESTTVDEQVNSSGNANENNSTGVTVNNFSDALEVEGIEFMYKGFEVCSSFPEIDGTPVFVIKAVEGKRLVVLNFDMKNTTNKDIKLDISAKKLTFKGIFNNSVKTNALVTLLPEAINTYISTIPAGKTVSGVIVFEMADKYVQDISSITMDVISSDGTKSIKLK